jgi:parallel beta-helix repeat protein
LYVPTPGVTVDLNGHTLSGSRSLVGINVFDASGVTIKGPGKITGFWGGITTLRSHELSVVGIDFENMGMGAAIAHSQKNTFYANTFTRISSTGLYFSDSSTTEPRRGLGYHNIADNAFKTVRSGIELCGLDTGGSVISGNSFAHMSDYAIHLRDGSQYNTLRSNVIVDIGLIGIVLRGSSNNAVETNLIEYGNQGIALYPEYSSSCIRPPGAAVVRNNRIDGNVIRKQHTGIYFGLGLAGTSVYKNYTRYNQLHDDAVGMHFRLDAVSNGGTTNDYTGTATSAIDESGFNSY